MEPRRRRIEVRASLVPAPAPDVAPEIADVYRKRYPWAAMLAGVAIGMAGVFFAWRAVAPATGSTDAASAIDTTFVAAEPEIAEPLPSEIAETADRTPSANRTPDAASPQPARGDRIARPTPASVVVETSRPSLPQRSAREIERAFDGDRAAYGACYQTGLANDANIEGLVFVRFTVGSDGTVSGVRIARSTLRSAVVEGCLVQVVSRWRFSAGRKAETFELEFPFARD